MKKALSFCLLFLFIMSLIIIPSANAQDSSPSADIKEKLKALQEEIASRAAAMKNEVSKKLLNKAYIGQITVKDNSSLSVSLKLKTVSINLNEFTEYIIKSKSLTGSAGLKNLATSDSIAALGDVDDNGVLTAKRIIKLSKPLTPKKVVYGVLTSVTKDSASLKTEQNDQFLIMFDKNTDFQLGKSESSLTSVQANKWIIAVTEAVPASTADTKISTISATPNNQPQTYLAKFVYIFPTGIVVKPKTSTPSAIKK